MDEHHEQVERTNTYKKEAFEWIKAILIAAGLVVIVRSFFFAPFIVEGPSMQPNFETGERLIVNKILYNIRAPKRGEVIVFHAPSGKDYIKRVIALPGESIKVDGDYVLINGKRLSEPYIQEQLDEAARRGTIYNKGRDFLVTEGGVVMPSEVPAEHVFVMGDNRPNSEDSRFSEVGFIPFAKIVGRADVIFWPAKQIGRIAHPEVNP